MAKAILICGKVCSGKTTYAKKLQEKQGGVLLSVDEIMNTFFDSCVGERRMEFEERAKKYLYGKSLEILAEGRDVYLDWGFWTKEERAYAGEFYRAHHFPSELHCILVDDEEWHRRRNKRNALIEAGQIRAFYVDEERASRFGGMFETPAESEVDRWVPLEEKKEAGVPFVIRRACEKDLPGLNALLLQVLMVHHKGRPDIFKPYAKKYSDAEILTILQDANTPVFVAVDEGEKVLGYAFCIFKQNQNHPIFTDIKSLYIDDLCVDEALRGLHVGRQLYDYVLKFARENNCYSVTLNVWSCNESAMRFYEKRGLVPQKIGMEQIL